MQNTANHLPSSQMHINERAGLFHSHQHLLLKYECVSLCECPAYQTAAFNGNHYSRQMESGRSFPFYFERARAARQSINAREADESYK